MRNFRIGLVVAGVIATVVIGALVDRTTHSVSDTLYGSAVPVALVWLVIGAALFMTRPRTA
jgi:hypothetical protein